MPRDPKRITIILAKLHRAWSLSPDQRLGQFISNLMGPGQHDVFYPEDDFWEMLIDQFLTEHKQ